MIKSDLIRLIRHLKTFKHFQSSPESILLEFDKKAYRGEVADNRGKDRPRKVQDISNVVSDQRSRADEQPDDNPKHHQLLPHKPPARVCHKLSEQPHILHNLARKNSVRQKAVDIGE